MKKLIVVLLGLILTMGVEAQKSKSSEENLRKLFMAETAITNLYVDSVDEKKLVEDAIIGMLKKLDPHSTYTNAEETRKMNEPLEGNFEGIGIQFNILEDTLVVIQPVTKGPSEKVGIMAGDRILSCNDTLLSGVKRDRMDIMKRLRGPKDSKVKLVIARRGVNEPLVFYVTRDKIPVYSLDAKYMIEPHIGYIRIGNFGATTYQETFKALADLKKQGMKDLILDLQDNGGGYLNAAIDIANEFLEQGDRVVYTEGRMIKHTEYCAKGGGSFRKGKLIVLVNEFTASASEIVAGAIQDQDRGMVVGRRSFGKGLVQRPIALLDGSLIRLTVSHYYTPSGRCIQKPYVKGQEDEYEKDVYNRLKNGELTHVDSIHFADSLKYTTLRKQRIVYGGGGIMPDYFVPLDTMKYTKFYRNLRMKNVITTTSMKYIDQNRENLKKQYKNANDFIAQYKVPQKEIDLLIAEGKAAKVEPKDDAELQKSLPNLRLVLKALTARDLWDISEYFQVINTDDAVIKKTLELLH